MFGYSVVWLYNCLVVWLYVSLVVLSFGCLVVHLVVWLFGLLVVQLLGGFLMIRLYPQHIVQGGTEVAKGCAAGFHGAQVVVVPKPHDAARPIGHQALPCSTDKVKHNCSDQPGGIGVCISQLTD